MDNVHFLSVSGTAVRVVCFATVILSRNATHSLSRTGNRGRCLTRLNNSCEGHKGKSGTDVFYFRSEVFYTIEINNQINKFFFFLSRRSNAVFSLF